MGELGLGLGLGLGTARGEEKQEKGKAYCRIERAMSGKEHEGGGSTVITNAYSKPKSK